MSGKLNCKPGDRAIVIRGINAGKLVRVIEPGPGNALPPGTRYPYGGLSWITPKNLGFVWIVEALGVEGLKSAHPSGRPGPVRKVRPFADRLLRPLPDNVDDQDTDTERDLPAPTVNVNDLRVAEEA